MSKFKYDFESFDSLAALNDSKVIFGDVKGNNNKYYKISITDTDYTYGITYYDNGIKPGILLNEDNCNLFVGFDKDVICFNISSNQILIRKKLASLFYEFIEVKSQNVIIVICELDIYVLDNKATILWEIGFRDIINDFYVFEDDKIIIECEDGEKFIFSIKNGQVIN